MAILMSGALTTPTKLAEELGITYSSATQTQKDNIDISINIATEKIESFCNRKFLEQEYTTVMKVIGDSIIFPVYPITTIVSCTETLDYDADLQTLDKGILMLDSLLAVVLGITYTAGWKLPGDAARDLPYSIEKAAIKLASSEYKSIGKITNVNPVKSEKIFDYSYTLSDKINATGVNLSTDILNLLAPWVIV